MIHTKIDAIIKHHLKRFDEMRDLIQKSIDRGIGDTTFELLRDDIENFRVQFWPLKNSALITRILHYPTGIKALEVWFGMGKAEEIVEFLSTAMEDYAKAEGCKYILSYGARTGWNPIAKKHGYKTGMSLYTKELT